MIEPYFHEENFTLYNDDALYVLEQLNNQKFDLIFVDPPYFLYRAK